MTGEETASTTSNGGTDVIIKVSDSNYCIYSSQVGKRTRCGANIRASKFIGVVPHQNGHWGCQVYANCQSLWFGTFKTEEEAAVAYDRAALKLHNMVSHGNFMATDVTVDEANFQSRYTVESVLNMIKDGTYPSKFTDFLRTNPLGVEAGISLKLENPQSDRTLTCKLLFQKELTPSDVGKLNRLVIPKKFAVKFFLDVPGSVEEDASGNKLTDVFLAFYDRSMRLWRFHFCYWKSSQSYVFTRGWNQFVKEKQLKANDTITFLLCKTQGNSEDTQSYYMINVNNEGQCSSLLESGSQTVTAETELQLRLGQSAKCDYEDQVFIQSSSGNSSNRKSFRLFGTEMI